MAAPTKPRSTCCGEIGKVDRIPEFIKRAKDKNDSYRLMGFGHRVYKNYDPRAKIMQKTCHEVLTELGIKDDPLLDVAMELEKIALHDEYFLEKKLYPNIDFYSGITLKAMGFPTTMFTVLFALARTVGWIAQWKEMIEDPKQKIGRPRQLYTGADAARLHADFATEIIQRGLTALAVIAATVELRRLGAVVSPGQIDAAPGKAAAERGKQHPVAGPAACFRSPTGTAESWPWWCCRICGW